MKTILIKTFLIVVVLTISTITETISLNFVNEKDDLLSGLAFIISIGIVLLTIYTLYKIVITNNKNQNDTINANTKESN